MRIMTEPEYRLVEAHMALVETVIQRHITVRPDIPGMEHDDLFQVGSLALCHAAQKYDGRCQFSTFAYTVIKNALLDHCRSIMGKASRTVSLEHTGDEDAGSMLDLIADSQSVSDTAEARATLQFLAKAGKHYRGVARKGGPRHRDAGVRLLHPRDCRFVWGAVQCSGCLGEPGKEDAERGVPGSHSIHGLIAPLFSAFRAAVPLWAQGHSKGAAGGRISSLSGPFCNFAVL